MFQQPKYIQNSFSIFFPRQLTIRRKANEFEDRLTGQYFQPQIIPVPDDFDPEMPRLIFGSEHGFSQIIISQINISLNVSYSPDWQIDIEKGKAYLIEKVPILFDLVDLLGESSIHFCGFSIRVRLPTQADEQAILSHFARLFLADQDIFNLHDVQIKKTKTVSQQFFSNINLSNYRVWIFPESGGFIPHLSKSQVMERGIEIFGDYNDRYAYNENQSYSSNRNIAHDIIYQGIDEVNKFITLVEG